MTVTMDVHKAILATIYAVLATTGILGNSAVIAAVCLSMKLRTVTNAFVVTLSISDIINSATLIVQVVALADVRTEAFLTLCTIVGPVAIIVLAASTFLMTLIAFCRFVLITKQAQTFQRVFSRRAVAAMIITCFIFPAALIMLFLFLDLASAGLNEDTICTFYNSPIFNYLCGGLMIVFLIVVSYFYASIFLFLRKHFRSLRRQSSAQVRPAASPSRASTAEHAQSRDHKLELESTITKNMLIVLCAFALCFLPFAFTLLLSEDALLGAYLFAVLNASSCINPFLFGWKHPVFRQVFRCMFRGKFREIEEPAAWLRKLHQRADSDI